MQLIESYFKTHYSIADNLLFQRFGDLWGMGDKMAILWMQMNVRKASRDTGYHPMYLVDKMGVDLYCHLTNNTKIRDVLKNVTSEYMVAFCNKIVWDETQKNYRNMPYPYFVFTKDPIDPKNGLSPYEERMYRVVG
jgi:hypothetical protein